MVSAVWRQLGRRAAGERRLNADRRNRIYESVYTETDRDGNRARLPIRQFAGRSAPQGLSSQEQRSRNLPPRRRNRAAREKERSRHGRGLRSAHGNPVGCVRRHQGNAAAAGARGALMATFLLDTNICIYIRRNDPPRVRKRFEQLDPGESALSVITYADSAMGPAGNPEPPAA